MPLAPFEHFMLADDSHDYPKSFFIQLKFQGRFDRPQLTAALKAALKLHPLLNSRIHGSVTEATSRIAWIESTSPPPTIDWNDAGDRRMVSGGLILESIEAIMPLPPLTHVAFVASNYRGKLSLSISHDPRGIDAAAARELLESYVRQLTASLEQSNSKRKDSHAVVRPAAQRVVDEGPVNVEVEVALKQELIGHRLCDGPPVFL